MSSLFAALGVAVTGLSAQSSAIGNISDNLSNAQTTGYKTIGTNFQSLVTASSATDNSPGGVRATPSYQNDVQGTINSTSTTTNLAISGGGFFAVQSASQSSTGATTFGSTYYTRSGDFTLNKDGYLVNSPGYYLTGYTVNSTTGLPNSSTATPIQISNLLDNPVPTSTVTYTANLPANAASSYTSTASSVQIYDSLGNTHATSISWAKGATANNWTATVSVADGSGTSGTPKTYTLPFVFNTDGTLKSITADSNNPATYTVSGGTVSLLGLSFPGAGTQAISMAFGTPNSSTGVTQFANTNSQVSVTAFQQNGLPQGSFSSLGIDSSGNVSINYSNGSSREIYQIPIVTFNSPDNLQRVTGGAYQATLASGTANYFQAGTNGAGTVDSGSLEASDVDVASQFTTMIQAQQVYSANAKTVTTINQMLTTIIQAIQ